MAPALWPRVGSILWLACLLPWAPAAVAAGKAPRGRPPVLPQPWRARGLAASPGSGAGPVRPARSSLLSRAPAPPCAGDTASWAPQDPLLSTLTALPRSLLATRVPRAPRFHLQMGPALGTARRGPRIHPDTWGPRSRREWGRTMRGDREGARSGPAPQPPRRRSRVARGAALLP